MQYLTDEDTAVINAMRMGGKVEVHFFDSSEDAAEKHYEELKDIITQKRVNALVSESSSIKFDSYEFKIGNHAIYHFVDAKNRP
jgi:adenylyl- and sulfurtransferase ThiI